VRFGTRWIAKSRNDIAECEETAVDGNAFFDTVAYRSRTLELFISQIKKCDMAYSRARLTRSEPAKSTKWNLETIVTHSPVASSSP
jgi:hypothetical protein